MLSKEFLTRAGICTAATLTFTGCVPMVNSTQDMNRDRATYLSQNFDFATLPPATQTSIRRDATPAKFKKVTLVVDNAFENSTGTKEASRTTTTFINKGNGLIEEMNESSNNDIAFSVQFELNYKGLVWLKRQNFRLANTNGNWPIEVKSIATFPAFDKDLQENTDYTYAYSYGTTAQLMNFQDFKIAYHTGVYHPASDVFPKLEGRAIDLAVEDFSKGAVTSKSKWVYLADLGFAVAMDSATSVTKTTHKIQDVKIER